MASHPGDDPRGASLSEEEARAAVASLEQDGARLAERLPMGRGTLMAYAALIAVFVGADALPGFWAIAVSVLALAGMLRVPAFDRRRRGVMPAGPLGPRATWLFVGLLAVALAAKMSVLALSESSVSPWWTTIPVGVAFVGVLALGGRYFREMRTQLALRTGGRT